MGVSNVLEFSNRAQTLPQRSSRQSARCGVKVTDATLEYPIGAMTRGSIKSAVMSLFGSRTEAAKVEYVRALDGVSFELQHGERVGIIGRNGAGKSTTLRALAGIYPLKSGSIEVEGEIGTLLDITLGFEPESTGRENIYNRGLAMGVHPKLLAQYEDEIVQFADLGPFIDLPVRTYSAGMYVRLGFAISTQFAPDVLLIDEVFGAGDAAFAQRALVRMEEVLANSGLLVLVTHDISLVRRVCTRVIWLQQGKIILDGDTEAVLGAYLASAV